MQPDDRAFRRIVALLIVLQFAACTAKRNQELGQTGTNSTGTALEEYQSLTSQQDAIGVILKQLKSQFPAFEQRTSRTIKQMRSVASTSAADAAFLSFRRDQMARADTFTKQLAEVPAVERVESNEVATSSLRAALQLQGYDLLFDEGTPFVDESMDYLLTTYGGLVTSGMREYLNLRRSEQHAGFSSDAGLTISWDALAERVANWERFLATYPSFVGKDDASWWYQIYLRTYLTGLDNSRVFEDDGALVPHVRRSYDLFLANHSDSKSGRLLEEYLNVLKQNGYKNGPAAEKFLSDHNLHSMLGMGPPVR